MVKRSMGFEPMAISKISPKAAMLTIEMTEVNQACLRRVWTEISDMGHESRSSPRPD